MTEPATPESFPQRRADLHLVRSESPDMLAHMFEGQRELMDKYYDIESVNGSPVIFQEQEGNLDDRQVQARLHEVFGFAVREWSEAMQELKNKPWRQSLTETDRESFINEVGDTMHFFIEFCITSGITPEELYDAYFRMHMKNKGRQQSDY